MHAKVIREGIHWMGAVDWDRRWFDALVPTPQGTSYNAWLVEGTQKTVRWTRWTTRWPAT